MGTPERRIAIILHGPPGAGKSTVCEELLARHATRSRRVSLDDGWAPRERRYARGTGQYADLAAASEPILLVELACGEPPELSFPGATKAAQVWVNVLRGVGRELFPFLLWVGWDEAIRRLEQRHQGRPDNLLQMWCQLGVYALYERRHRMVTFPPLESFPQEQLIWTANRPIGEVADEISRLAGI